MLKISFLSKLLPPVLLLPWIFRLYAFLKFLGVRASDPLLVFVLFEDVSSFESL